MVRLRPTDSGYVSKILSWGIPLVIIVVLFMVGRNMYLTMRAEARAKDQAATIAGQLQDLVGEYKTANVGNCDKNTTGTWVASGHKWCGRNYYFEVPPATAQEIRYRLLEMGWDEHGGDLDHQYVHNELVCHFFPDGELADYTLRKVFNIAEPEMHSEYVYTFLRCDART